MINEDVIHADVLSFSQADLASLCCFCSAKNMHVQNQKAFREMSTRILTNLYICLIFLLVERVSHPTLKKKVSYDASLVAPVTIWAASRLRFPRL